MNHFAGKVVVSAQDNLMKARDERVALMNEVRGGPFPYLLVVVRFELTNYLQMILVHRFSAASEC